MAVYPDDIFTPGISPIETNTDNGTIELDAAYFDLRDYEINAIENALGAFLVPDTSTAFVDYAAVKKTGATLYLNLAPSGGDKVGVGSFCPDIPDGWLHVRQGDAGEVTPKAWADDLVIENNTTVGMTMMFPDDQNGNIFWASPRGANRGLMQYVGPDKTFEIGANEAGGEVRFRTDTNVLAVKIDKDQNTTFYGSVILDQDSTPAVPIAAASAACT